jgi:hypothetical protein
MQGIKNDEALAQLLHARKMASKWISPGSVILRIDYHCTAPLPFAADEDRLVL